MSYLELLKLASPEAVVVLTALVVLAIGLTSDTADRMSSVAAATGLIAGIVAVTLLPQNAVLFGGMLIVSPLTSLFKIICLVLALFTVLLSSSQRSLAHQSEYLAMVLLATLGLMLLVGSEELLVIFIGLELLGLSLYVMTAFDKTSIRSAEAGLKYFLFGSTASAFTLFGISLIYGMAATTSLPSIAQKLATAPLEPLLAAGIVMTLIGFAFKIAAAPLHLWAPDAYQGGPVTSAAFIASASKVASFVVLGRIVLVGFAPLHGSAAWHDFIAGWVPMLALLSAFSILIGNFVALVQTNVRRLLAYSAVAHAGYTLLGLIAGGREGFGATLFYTTIYALTLIGAFAVVGEVRSATGGEDLKDFAGLFTKSPLLAAAMAIFMLSLAGLPPLAGFFGKFYLFSVAIQAGGNYGLAWLVALALFGSLVSLYYYLIVLKAIFVDQVQTLPSLPPIRLNIIERALLVILAVAIVGFGVAPQMLLDRILAALP